MGMDAAQTTVEKLGSRMANPEARISVLEDEGQKNAGMSEAIAATVNQLQQKVAYLGDAGRCNNVHIVCVEEGAEGNDLNTFVRKCISQILNMDATKDFEIESALDSVGTAMSSYSL